MKTEAFIAVEVVKEWTDRGDQDWVTIEFKTNNGIIQLNVNPEQLVRLTKTWVEMPF